jgi:phosphoglycerate dehydrogenase-like enzyme
MGGGPATDHLLCALPFPEPKEITNHLRSKFPQIEISYVEVPFTFNPKSIEDSLPQGVFKDTTILYTFAALPKTRDDAPHLEVLQLLSAGSNQVQNNWIWEDEDVSLCTASGIHGPQIAEWVVMTALVHTHGYKQLYEHQKQREWAKLSGGIGTRDRVGLRVGVLGYGSIGRQVGRVVKAMGMEVVAYTASPRKSKEDKKDKGFIVPGTGDPDGSIPTEWYSGLDKESLHEFLRQDLDWIVVAVPLTEQTTRFLGKGEFEVLSKNATRTKPFVTNIARGQIINQPDLIEALKHGTLGGAAVDVTVRFLNGSHRRHIC